MEQFGDLFGQREIWPLLQAVWWLAVILVLLAGGILGARRLRQWYGSRDKSTHEMLAEFRDLRDRGGLSDIEYQTIRAKLANDLNDEWGKIERRN